MNRRARSQRSVEHNWRRRNKRNSTNWSTTKCIKSTVSALSTLSLVKSNNYIYVYISYEWHWLFIEQISWLVGVNELENIWIHSATKQAWMCSIHCSLTLKCEISIRVLFRIMLTTQSLQSNFLSLHFEWTREINMYFFIRKQNKT